jgi:hypothetical protein
MDLVTGLLIYVSMLLTLIVVVGSFFLLAASRTPPPHHPSYNEVFTAQQEAAKRVADALEGPLVDAITAAVKRSILRPP